MSLVRRPSGGLLDARGDDRTVPGESVGRTLGTRYSIIARAAKGLAIMEGEG